MFDGPCCNGYFATACEAVARMQTKLPNGDIKDYHVTGPDCENNFVPQNASSSDIVIMIGFGYEACSMKAGPAAPNTWIVLVDACPADAGNHANIVCALFSEAQPSYVAVYLAGLFSETRNKVVGVVEF